VHDAVFTPERGLFGKMRKVYQKLGAGENETRHLPLRVLHAIEHAGKSMAFGCKDCGDCSLPDCAYLCPEASCSKGSRNGPCGGSADGVCELGDKPCLWVRAYERLKHYGESEHMLDGGAVFIDHQLEGTSSWANTFLGRDHHRVSADHNKDENNATGRTDDHR